mmetsp:Transcript_9160/g.13804  ORF Transcript_9160/g.13804 Transcript_9160/m.13804 type:complete len:104 (-) Transcript_9160:209-520(-)
MKGSKKRPLLICSFKSSELSIQSPFKSNVDEQPGLVSDSSKHLQDALGGDFGLPSSTLYSQVPRPEQFAGQKRSGHTVDKRGQVNLKSKSPNMLLYGFITSKS